MLNVCMLRDVCCVAVSIWAFSTPAVLNHGLNPAAGPALDLQNWTCNLWAPIEGLANAAAAACSWGRVSAVANL